MYGLRSWDISSASKETPRSFRAWDFGMGILVGVRRGIRKVEIITAFYLYVVQDQETRQNSLTSIPAWRDTVGSQITRGCLLGSYGLLSKLYKNT